ncbi:MAG: hypothetical protein IPN89_17485 [Saprospiraceae bacterium]|nr:hypothetical protein [Saprospiraceae bacterium]
MPQPSVKLAVHICDFSQPAPVTPPSTTTMVPGLQASVKVNTGATMVGLQPLFSLTAVVAITGLIASTVHV